MRRRLTPFLSPMLISAVVGSCTSESDPEGEIELLPPSAPDPRVLSTLPAPALDRMEIEVNLAERELQVHRGGAVVATYPVAVGREERPTPTGEWTIHEVVWNPRWTPPDEDWADQEVERGPGDPRNPLGAAQLVFGLPNSVHGTHDSSSLGKAVSNGSIRVSNEVARTLARQVMEAGGAARDEAWFRTVEESRGKEYRVPLPSPVTIRVLSRAGPGSGSV